MIASGMLRTLRNSYLLTTALFLIGMGVLLLAGCAPHPKESAKGEVVLEFWTLQLLSFKETLEPMMRRYETEHPGIRIKWVDVPFSEGEKRTLTAMMSPTMPDVVNLNPDFSAVLASRKAVLDMNQAVSETDRKAYLPVAWQAASLDNYAFGVPWYLTSGVTLYNEAVLKGAGMTTPPKNFQELEALGQKLASAGGREYAVMPTIAESGNFLKELKKAGIPLYGPDGRAVFADEGAAGQLQFWVDMYKNGWVPAESLTEGHRAAVDRYQAGTLGMLLTGPNFLNIVRENAPKVFEETGVAPQFPAEGAYTDFSTMVLVVPAKSAHPKEAVDFALYMTNAANQLALAQQAPVLPSVTDALKSPYFQQQNSKDLVSRARSISAAQLLKAKEAYHIRPGQHDINEIMNFFVQSALLGKMTPDAAMRQAQREINILLSAND